jgi:hypothetical protein
MEALAALTPGKGPLRVLDRWLPGSGVYGRGGEEKHFWNCWEMNPGSSNPQPIIEVLKAQACNLITLFCLQCRYGSVNNRGGLLPLYIFVGLSLSVVEIN